MNDKALVFEVGEQGFERYVVDNSHKAPVLVEFMGVWSESCVDQGVRALDLALLLRINRVRVKTCEGVVRTIIHNQWY